MASAASIVLTITVSLFLLTGCTKEDPKPSTETTYPINGLWIGTYTVDGQPSLGEQYFSFIIKPDGTMINDTKFSNQQHLAPGTWTLSGNTLSCTFISVYVFRKILALLKPPQPLGTIKENSHQEFGKM